MTEVRYTVQVYVTQRVEDGDNPRDYVSQASKVAWEKDIWRKLKSAYPHCDVDAETMDAELLSDAFEQQAG